YELKVQEDSIKNIEREKLNESQLALSETKIKDTKNLIIVVSIVVILLMLFSVIVYIRYKESVKQKKIIAEQKEQVDIAFNQLDEKKVELEKKNTEIMDSINYAKYIQKALLPSKESIENFFENQFIYYLPKDIVGGDFYCFKSIGDQAVIVAGDCTGHGVPGGFGTMIGSLVIEKSLKKGLKDPNQILTDLNYGIVTLLKQYKDDSIQDGMDISICLVDKKTKKVKFSGSRNGIHIVETDEIHSIKGDLTPVGGYAASHEESKNRSYQLHEIGLKDNQWIFMYSDGFYDQFGGPRNKSMGSSRFRGIIQEAVTMNKTNTPDFKNYFFDWMGDEEQIDDVLVIGFKL
ncbi:MAG: SpoIIE family protein phosphatase, partial [Bacteroidota bacterium]|nr:SpoIIE family protein phosphatase [Bacteroidota bacterium]